MKNHLQKLVLKIEPNNAKILEFYDFLKNNINDCNFNNFSLIFNYNLLVENEEVVSE